MSSKAGSKAPLVEALDECLQGLLAGDSLESVLSRHTAMAAELRPLLETSLAAVAFQQQLAVPPGTQSQSRLRYVNRAHELVDRPSPRWLAFRFSPVALASLIVVCILLVLGTGITSAYSKPGDVLYPMKLVSENTRLLLTTNPSERLQLQESFDTERLNEVEAIIVEQSTPEVTFSGVLTRSDSQEWSINRVRLILPETLIPQTENLQGMGVEVHGMLNKDGSLLVEEIQLHQLDFKGTVQEISADQWMISQIKVKVDSHTAIDGQVQVGDTVLVKVARLSDLTLRAVQIGIISMGSEDRHPFLTATTQKTEDENHSEDSIESATQPAPTISVENHLEPTRAGDKTIQQKTSPTPGREQEDQGSTDKSSRKATPQPTPTRKKGDSSDD